MVYLVQQIVVGELKHADQTDVQRRPLYGKQRKRRANGGAQAEEDTS